jgi:hypothetical protein
MKFKAVLILLVFQLAVVIDSLAQCSMCEAVLESNALDNQQSLAEGINGGILYLMAVVYLALFLIFRKRIRVFWVEFRALWTNPH